MRAMTKSACQLSHGYDNSTGDCVKLMALLQKQLPLLMAMLPDSLNNYLLSRDLRGRLFAAIFTILNWQEIFFVVLMVCGLKLVL